MRRAAGPSPKPDRTRPGAGFPVGAVVGAGSVTAVANLPIFLVGALATMIRPDLGFSETGTGAAVSVFMATSALAGLVLGRWVQDWGAAAAVRVASGTTGVALLGIAVLARNWIVLAACLLVAGAANATGQMAANMVLAERSMPGRDGLAFGMKQAAVPVATMVAGASVPVALGVVDWRWVFVFGAGLAGSVVASGSRIAAGSRRRRRRPEVPPRHPGKPLNRRLIVLVTLGAFFAAGAANTFVIFIVDYAVSVGWSLGAAGTLLATSSVGVLVARVLAGWIYDRRASRGRAAIALQPASTMVALGGTGVLLVMVGSRSPVLLVVGTLLAMLMGWGWPGLMHLAVVSMDRGAAARSTSFILVGVFGGGVVMPVLLGVLAEQVSYQVGWACNATFLMLAAASFRWARSVYEQSI